MLLATYQCMYIYLLGGFESEGQGHGIGSQEQQAARLGGKIVPNGYVVVECYETTIFHSSKMVRKYRSEAKQNFTRSEESKEEAEDAVDSRSYTLTRSYLSMTIP